VTKLIRAPSDSKYKHIAYAFSPRNQKGRRSVLGLIRIKLPSEALRLRSHPNKPAAPHLAVCGEGSLP